MDQTLIDRYKPGGDIFETLEAQYGRNGALLVTQAALTGDRKAVSTAIGQAKYGAALDESTASILWGQLTTDPLGAPLDAANKALSTLSANTLLAFFRNPMVLLVVVLIGAGIFINFFGLPRFLKKGN